MSKNGSYIGGSTIARVGTSWFSRPQPGVDPESGETREERIKRLAAEATRRKEMKEKQAKQAKKKPPMNATKKHAKDIEKRRQKKIERNRSRLAEKEAVPPIKARQCDAQEQERMSKVTIEKKQKKQLMLAEVARSRSF